MRSSCGGGFSGFAAAYQAAKEGMKVILIERNACLGGVGTSGLVNHLLGERYIENGKIGTCVGGIFKELEEALLKNDAGVDFRTVDLHLPPHGWFAGLGIGLIFDKEKMKLMLEEMLQSAGVKVLYMTDIIDVCKEGRNLKGVLVHNKGGLAVIEGSYFVDATGDADICVLAGEKVHKGDEDGGLAAASLEMHVENVDAEELTEYMRTTDDRRFRAIINRLKESGEWKFPYEIFISVKLMKNDVFMINTIRQVGIDGTDTESVSRGIIDGRKENFELLEIARKHFPGFRNARVREIAPVMGIRETNRLDGVYTLTVEDLITGKEFDDGIALSGYGWDMPNPKKPSFQPFHGVQRKSPITQIPYRALLPKETDNLLTVGRCISAEREVLGPIRVMGPCIAMGEAAGTAAGLAWSEKKTFGQINIQSLREKIRSNGGLVERKQVVEER